MPKRVGIWGRKTAPKGHFVVYVGTEMTRFVVPMSVLKNALFQELLHKAADEYGFDCSSKLLLPCDEFTFRRLIASIAAVMP